VFYDDVRTPLANVVGAIGDGWSVAISTLGFERGTGFMKLQTELSVPLESLVDDASGLGALDDSSVAERLSELRADVLAMRAMTTQRSPTSLCTRCPSEMSEDDVKVTAVLREGARLTTEELCRCPTIPYPGTSNSEAACPATPPGRC
jgi:alkylation response protein AidB-like acyl-CoA dehydrogenase